MNKVQQMAAKAALQKMVSDGYLSICTIDKIVKAGKLMPPKEDMEILGMLHCVHFSEMDPELRRGLPLILQRVLSSEGFAFEFNNMHSITLIS